MKCKKFLSLLLALVMLFSMVPVVSAAGGNKIVEIRYIYEDGKTAATSWTASLGEGTDYSGTVPHPTIVGYQVGNVAYTAEGVTHTDTEVVLNLVDIRSDITVTVTYTPAIVNYTVNIYHQNLNDDGYELVNTLEKSGLTGSPIAKVTEAYDGFTQLLYDETTTIAADGSTVVDVYYDRNYYLMTFDLGGGYGVDPIYARYGTPITNVGNPTKAGCAFVGWELDGVSAELPATMPSESRKYTATWSPEDTANVSVVFWGENANDTEYSYERSTTIQGTPDSTLTYNESMGTMDSNLWVFNHADTITVAADGSSVLNVYFNRRQMTLTLKYDYHNYVLWQRYDKTETITAKWGANIAAQFTKVCNGAGSTFWTLNEGGSGPYTNYIGVMPTASATYYNQGKSGNSGSMYYYGESLTDGDYSVPLYEVPNVGGYNVTVEDRYEFEGFTYDHGTEIGENCGNARFYYKRNSYNLVFNNGEKNLVTSSVKYEASLGAYDFTPTEVPSFYEAGSVAFAGWYLNPECSGEQYILSDHNMPASNLILYAKWVPVEHTVRFYMNNQMDTEIVENRQQVLHGSFANPVPNPENGLYTFIGWFYNEDGTEKAFDLENMPVRKDLDLYAKWSSNTLMSYTIHYQDENGNPIADDTTGSALAGSTKTFEAKTGAELYPKFQDGYFPETRSHSITLDIENTENNVYTFTYVQLDAVPYTVRYLDAATNEPLHKEKPVSDNRKSVVTENAETIPGYMPDAFQKRLIITADEENILVFYYTADTAHAFVTEKHCLLDANGNEVSSEYSEFTGDIGTTYDAARREYAGYAFDHVTVNGEAAELDADGKVSGTLTGTGLHFEFYYTYNRFDVYYQSTQSKETYDLVDSFSVTDKVHVGYLYGGMYSDETFATPLTEETICGLGFTPKAGETYYVKEVPEAYLQPKVFVVYDKNNHNALVRIYLVTAIDDENYRKVGFDVAGQDGRYVENVNGNVYQTVNVNERETWSGPVTTKVLKVKNFFNNLEKGFLNVQLYTDGIEQDKSFSFIPFFVTLDGVKVTGVVNRTVNFGDATQNKPDGYNVNDVSATSQCTSYTEDDGAMLRVQSTFSIDWNEAKEHTVTKIDNGTTTTQTVSAGDQTGKITYAGKKGSLFAGWFTDEACTTPADFSDVQSDMTVYAKYISASAVTLSINVKNRKTGTLEASVTLPNDAFTEVGYVCSYKGTEQTVNAQNKTQKRGILDWLTGKAPKYSYSENVTLSGLKNRDSFTVTPYWVTLDGTVVTGTASAFSYFLNIIIPM